ncbi:uncharacterized protein [Palaemon carinicauda]|uniref:uncharacterized protein n=1 Tax=Palaemon carinicauda TaxID=392227 RepID=UPI0035B58AF1
MQKKHNITSWKIHGSLNQFNCHGTPLCPPRFDVDPDSAQAAKEWTPWLRMFTNFVQAVQLTTPMLDKLVLLTNYVAPSVYDYISECETYEKAEEVLTSLYVKPNNEIFARYLLATRRKNSGEPMDQFLQALKRLAKDCQFKSETAEEACDSYVRDAFIDGLVSGAIRQRLLENLTLNLNTAYEQACTQEMAQKHSSSYSSAEPVKAAVSACLEKSITPLKPNGSTVSALIDTGSSHSFVHHNLVDLNKLPMSPEHGKVSMADDSLSSNILGLCSVDFELKGDTYHGVKLKNLTPDCRPVANKSRLYSLSDKKFIETEIERMMSE